MVQGVESVGQEVLWHHWCYSARCLQCCVLHCQLHLLEVYVDPEYEIGKIIC